MKYTYNGAPGHNPSIVGILTSGCEIEEKDVSVGALTGLVGAGILTPVISKPKPKIAEEGKL